MASPPTNPDTGSAEPVETAKPSPRKFVIRPGPIAPAQESGDSVADGSLEEFKEVEEVDILVDGVEWRAVMVEPPAPNPDGSIDAKTRARRRLVSHLLDVQLSEHLMMMSGLGTSMCVVNDKGQKPAPTMGRLWEVVSSAAGPTFPKVLAGVKYLAGSNDIEVLLSRCHGYQDLQPDAEIAAFITLAEKQIGDLCLAVTDGPWTLPVHETFLRRLIARPTRLPRLHLFSTNYDLVWERAASNVKAVVIDGFTHADPQEFDPECFEYDVVRRDGNEAPQYIPKVFHLG